MTLVMGISNLGAGVAVDRFGLTPNDVMFWVGVFFFLPGILWSLFFLTVCKHAKPDHSEKKLPEDIAPLITLSGKEQEKILDHLPIK